MKTKQIVTTITATNVDGTGAEAAMVISTGNVDREGDRILASGADVSNYRRNPVLLWGHQTGSSFSPPSLPIGSVVELDVTDSGIRAGWRWLQNDEFSERVRNAWDQGVVRSASIGFFPRKSKENRYGGRDYEEWELLEVSLVPLPANPQAVRVLRSLGLTDWKTSSSRGRLREILRRSIRQAMEKRSRGDVVLEIVPSPRGPSHYDIGAMERIKAQVKSDQDFREWQEKRRAKFNPDTTPFGRWTS